MLDIKFIRENKDIVALAVKNKNREVDLDELLSLFELRRGLRQKIDETNAKRNEASRARNIEEGSKLKKEVEKFEAEFNDINKKYLALMLKVPNVPSVDTPIGKDESENKVIRKIGEIPQFSFSPKDHHTLGTALGIIDTETAGAVSGARFAYLKGDLVLLQFALIQFCLSVLTNQNTLKKIAEDANLAITPTPFVPVIPPVFVKPAVQNRMARFLTPEEHYMFPADDLMLVGSAEHTLGPIYMDKILDPKNLPLRLVGYSTAFRREAGSYGKDTKGILRQHQFDKLEMETFTLPEDSQREQEFLVAVQEYILVALKLPYQVIMVCTGDMGFPDYRQIDIETWMPGENKYRETHSADLTASFQARRLNMRVKRADGTIEPVHMNDATVIALGRTLVAIMENYQQEDGSIHIPEVLKPYIGKESIR